MDEDERQVEVERVVPGGSIWTGEGKDVTTGEHVVFGGDWRPMRDIAEALQAGAAPVANVPSWAVLSAVTA